MVAGVVCLDWFEREMSLMGVFGYWCGLFGLVRKRNSMYGWKSLVAGVDPFGLVQKKNGMY